MLCFSMFLKNVKNTLISHLVSIELLFYSSYDSIKIKPKMLYDLLNSYLIRVLDINVKFYANKSRR